MTFRVLVPEQISPAGLQVLRAAGMEIVTPFAMDMETMKDAIADCHALLVRTMHVANDLLNAAPLLKVVPAMAQGWTMSTSATAPSMASPSRMHRSRTPMPLPSTP